MTKPTATAFASPAAATTSAPASAPTVAPTAEPTASASHPLVALQGASVHLDGRCLLHPLDWHCHRGERVALIGANGSGKSTLLRVLHGLQPLSGGQRRVQPGMHQAMLFQRPHMLRLSALHNVALALWLNGRGWQLARTQARAALAKVGLADVADLPARTLSGGQQQRLAMARACCLAPDMLMLDEPTASLDPHAKRDVEALMAELDPAMTLVFASHNLGQVKRLATRVLYLEHGRVLADLPVADFFREGVLPARYPEAHLFVKGESV